MNTNAISGTSTNALPQSSSTATPQTDTNMFMTLLVAQLKNQDPLAPQDGAAFVAQLAQFNSLDNLIGIRQSMEQLVASLYQAPNPNTPSDSDTTPNPSSTGR